MVEPLLLFLLLVLRLSLLISRLGVHSLLVGLPVRLLPLGLPLPRALQRLLRGGRGRRPLGARLHSTLLGRACRFEASSAESSPFGVAAGVPPILPAGVDDP